MEFLGITSVAAITVICFLIAEAIKATPLDEKWLPVICGCLGGILGPVGMKIMPDFPALPAHARGAGKSAERGKE